MPITYTQILEKDIVPKNVEDYSIKTEVVGKWQKRDVHLAIENTSKKNFGSLKRFGCRLFAGILALLFQKIASAVWALKGTSGKNVIVVVTDLTSSVKDTTHRVSIAAANAQLTPPTPSPLVTPPTSSSLAENINQVSLPLKPKADAIIEQFNSLAEAHHVMREVEAFGEFLKATPLEALNAARLSRKPELLFEKYKYFLKHEGVYIHETIKEITEDMKGEQIRWNQIRQRIYTAAVEANPFILSGKKITWITGSRAAAIPMIEHVAKTAIGRTALVPTGRLLEHNIAPLTGELFRGISASGINQTSLSGTALSGFNDCLRYAQIESFIFDPSKEVEKIKNFDHRYQPIAQLKVAVLRLLLMGEYKGLKDLKDYISDTILKRVDSTPLEKETGWQTSAHLLGELVPINLTRSPAQGVLKRGQVVCVPRSDGTIRFGIISEFIEWSKRYHVIADGDGGFKGVPLDLLQVPSKEALDALAVNALAVKPFLSEKLSLITQILKTEHEQISEIIELFDTVKPLDLSSESQSLIANSFPLIWGSCTVTATPFKSDIKEEQVVLGNAELGKEIEVVFTDSEHVDALRNAVGKYGVTVLSFDAARYIISRQLFAA